MLKEWHLSPVIVEEEWTDEQFNIFVDQYFERVFAENAREKKDSERQRIRDLYKG